jgi:hypothetical protein
MTEESGKPRRGVTNAGAPAASVPWRTGIVPETAGQNFMTILAKAI